MISAPANARVELAPQVDEGHLSRVLGIPMPYSPEGAMDLLVFVAVLVCMVRMSRMEWHCRESNSFAYCTCPLNKPLTGRDAMPVCDCSRRPCNCDGWWWEWLRVGEWVVVVVVRWNWRCSNVLENWFVGVVGAVE